jgi:hypothetical protein
MVKLVCSGLQHLNGLQLDEQMIHGHGLNQTDVSEAFIGSSKIVDIAAFQFLYLRWLRSSELWPRKHLI